MKLTACLVAWLVLFSTSSALGALDTNRFFPLMAWNWAPSDPTAFLKMRECGLTVAGFVAPRDLDACHAAGLKAIVADARTSTYDWTNVNEALARKKVTSLIEEVGKHPAVYGYYLVDEPSAAAFPGLATVASLVHELAPGKWAYINLFPNYASPAQLGTSDYREHLEQFVEIVKPRQLSYDHYAMMDDGSLRKGYWQNLEAMRSAAHKNMLPFWNIVLAVAHFNYREPNAADLRFQVYTTLAYGARGIAYFTYFAPKVGNYRGAPIDQFGNPTPTWHHLQNVNLQVAQLAPALLQLRSDEVYHFGQVPEGCRGPGDSSLVKKLNHPGFLVGDFTDLDGTRYAMIVNKTFSKSLNCRPEFRNAPKQVRMISPYTGQLVDFAGEQTWLAAGQGVLLRVEHD